MDRAGAAAARDPGEWSRGAGGRTLRDSIRRLEASLIGQTMRDTKGNKSETSRRLHLSYPALLAKIKQYGLEPGNPRKISAIRSKKPQ